MAPIPSSPSRLIKLSEIISRNSKLLNSYLAERKLPQPSFAPDAPTDGIVIGKDEPRRKELEKARRELVSATKELHDLSVGARESVRNLAWDFNSQLSLNFIAHHKLATLFPPSQTTTYTALAQKTKLPVHDLQRLIRHAIASSRIFSEPSKGVLAHTPASVLLSRDPETQAWVDMILEEFWPGATRVVEAMEKWPGSEEPVHTGLSVANGETKHLFTVLGADKARMERFGRAMASLSAGEGFEIGHLVTGYDWKQFEGQQGTVVDVGGSLGFASVALAEAYPGLKFVVQDLEKVYAGSDPQSKLPESVKGQIEFMAQDFFVENKVKGADVYLIRWCLHNWSDKYAIKILRALVPALKKGARIVVNDGVSPEPKGLGESWKDSKELTQDVAEGKETEAAVEEVNANWMGEKSMRGMDLIMLQGLNAKERDVDEWKELFRQADERFVWKGAWQPDGCRMWIIEAEWAG